jgi:hypothetical protein
MFTALLREPEMIIDELPDAWIEQGSAKIHVE